MRHILALRHNCDLAALEEAFVEYFGSNCRLFLTKLDVAVAERLASHFIHADRHTQYFSTFLKMLLDFIHGGCKVHIFDEDGPEESLILTHLAVHNRIVFCFFKSGC